MQICGFQKTTLLDYPEHIAATVFLGGCNFRCPFCYNSSLVLHPDSCKQYTKDTILSFLAKRKGILQGVCVTGGEPTLSDELPSFLFTIKELGYLIKLDTNGSNPEMLQSLYEQKLIDYVAMDVKSGISDYLSVCGLSATQTALIDNIKKSIHFLIHETDASRFQYEFRTTVVKPLHTAASFSEIAGLIHGAKRYFLQSYQKTDATLALTAAFPSRDASLLCAGFPDAATFDAYSIQELEAFAAIVRPYVSHVSLRGVE